MAPRRQSTEYTVLSAADYLEDYKGDYKPPDTQDIRQQIRWVGAGVSSNYISCFEHLSTSIIFDVVTRILLRSLCVNADSELESSWNTKYFTSILGTCAQGSLLVKCASGHSSALYNIKTIVTIGSYSSVVDIDGENNTSVDSSIILLV